jgi:hypothetical protein
MSRAEMNRPEFELKGRNNPFDWARSANQAAAVECAAILAIRTAGAVGGYFVPNPLSLGPQTGDGTFISLVFSTYHSRSR